ncbi:alpha-ketoglutarate-dependent dioxygenase AlkB [Pontibacter sp. G13]|uniref:alpha-ketoglutarate-dependent dioxygenase AlkB family protein n=1 Tax=Pontibacter sp. G13 TaxID=3074898 RepID=UPI0028894BD5|nr:alpha-ketoglutarate-dependent dioxygenase AlkB [Pontibacter sp. G13]WNJ19496.1 alpha-ketoglutarate-dependent dioxygenase AlkB [Pontibacter sp. G13]
MNPITFHPDYLSDPATIFDDLLHSVNWDERMRARKTASFGVPYNYSQITYPEAPFPPGIKFMLDQLEETLGFRPNNCLINYYLDGKSTMGWHSDQTDILEVDTGVAIISLGATRTLRFRKISDKDLKHDYPLPAGSMIYMTQEAQEIWQHAIPKADVQDGRMSLTFRLIKG